MNKTASPIDVGFVLKQLDAETEIIHRAGTTTKIVKVRDKRTKRILATAQNTDQDTAIAEAVAAAKFGKGIPDKPAGNAPVNAGEIDGITKKLRELEGRLTVIEKHLETSTDPVAPGEPEKADEPDNDAWNDVTVAYLRTLLIDHDIKPPTNAKKSELIALAIEAGITPPGQASAPDDNDDGA